MGFSAIIVKWYRSNKRDLPWRHTTDPYIIWLSEVILQQTRVDQGLPYFQQFTEKYPTVSALAAAPTRDVMKLWQGLGYYSRARNLHAAARQVVAGFGGVFPTDYSTLLKLKGVGAYTAAAVASFSTGQPVAVVDGNVYRLLSRFFGISTPIDSVSGKQEFSELATSLLPSKHPGLHNQAIMEFGALQCKPAAPDCQQCPLAGQCVAFKDNLVSQLPVKSKKQPVRDRHFNYLVIKRKNEILLRQRLAKDIWRELFELPLIETSAAVSPRKLLSSSAFRGLVKSGFTVDHVSEEVIHKLSHQTIRAWFYQLTVNTISSKDKTLLRVPVKQVHQYPVPRLVERYFEEHFIK